MVKVENSNNSKRATGKGYYDFMEFVKLSIIKYYQIFSQIQASIYNANKNKSLVRLVDKFHICAIRSTFYYLV